MWSAHFHCPGLHDPSGDTAQPLPGVDLLDGKYHAPGFFRWFEQKLDSGPQDWKQYTAALLIFNTVLFVYGFIALCLQPIAPLNPRWLGNIGSKHNLHDGWLVHH